MNFSEALINLKQGKKLNRKGWNGKHQFIRTYKSHICGDMFIIVNTATETINSWIPSVSDLYAEDWEIYGDCEQA